MVSASMSAIGYFMPVFAFLLVFIVIYALLAKTKVLGGNNWIMLFVSLMLSSFFIVEANLVELVEFSSAWISVLIVVVFFILLLLAFMPWDKPLEFLAKSNWFSIVLLGGIVAVFVLSSAYVFNWAVNWGMVRDWFYSDWFGMVLLLVIAAVVSWKIVKK